MASSSSNISGSSSSSSNSDSRFIQDVAYNRETARARSSNSNSEDADASIPSHESRKRLRSIERDPSFNQNSDQHARGEHNHGDPGTIIDRDGRHHQWRHTKNIPERTKSLQVLLRIVSHR